MMALGINFGIVPLLFLQTTYYKSFYTATILAAWWWIAVIPVLIIAYYSLYLAAYSGENRSRMILCSILASLSLVFIGIMNTNGITMMVSGTQWYAMLCDTSYYGAALGTANNFHDPVLWLRLATMFGLGLITAGVWATFDSHFLIRKNVAGVPENYRQWTTTLALLMTFFGAVIIIVMGKDTYQVSTIENPLLFPWVAAPAWTALLALLLAKYPGVSTSFLVGIAAVLQFLTLAAFGVIRQIGQNASMDKFNGIKVSELPEAVQWDTLIAFVLCFLLGVGVIVWMVAQCVKCAGKK
jgi:hypothetical protein